MLAIQGIPALYIHSLVATPNDLEHVEQTGRTRSINRKIWNRHELECLLSNPVTPQAEVFSELRRMIKIRRQQSAFHPDARQDIVRINSDLFIVKRTSVDNSQTLYALSNVTERILQLPLASLGFLPGGMSNLLSHDEADSALAEVLTLAPYQTVWLTQS